jgi:hypothetical protein
LRLISVSEMRVLAGFSFILVGMFIMLARLYITSKLGPNAIFRVNDNLVVPMSTFKLLADTFFITLVFIGVILFIFNKKISK